MNMNQLYYYYAYEYESIVVIEEYEKDSENIYNLLYRMESDMKRM